MSDSVMSSMNNRNTGKIAVCGVMMALTIVMIFLSSVIPGVNMSLLAVATCLTAFVIIETGIKYGTAFFAGAVILSSIIVPGKTAVVQYLMFFGLYPIIKYFAEKSPKKAVQIGIKAVFIVADLLIAYFLLFEIFFGGAELPFSLPAIFILPEMAVMFILLDIILTIIINIYIQKVHSKL